MQMDKVLNTQTCCTHTRRERGREGDNERKIENENANNIIKYLRYL